MIWKGLVYMVNENGTVYCIDPVSGENRWEPPQRPGQSGRH